MPVQSLDLLKRLRDDIYDSYCHPPTSELYHALMFRCGPRLTPADQEQWWQDFSCIRPELPPLGLSSSSSRRAVRIPPHFLGASPNHRYFGAEDQVALLMRFKKSVEQVARFARGALHAAGLDYIHQGFENSLNWCLACYLLAWDRPAEVPYGLEYLSFRDDQAVELPPIRDREAFEKWEEDAFRPAPGVYFVSLSVDVRAATVGAIDTTLQAVVGEEGRGVGVAPPSQGRGVPARITSDRATMTVTLDGHEYRFTHPGAFAVVERLISANFGPVSTDELRTLPGCKVRIDQLINNHVPEGLRGVIKSQSGPIGGYWIQLPPLERHRKK
jgi:hypothetical protein